MARVGIEWINDSPAPCTQSQLSYCDEKETDGLIDTASVLKAQFGYFEPGAPDRRAACAPDDPNVCEAWRF